MRVTHASVSHELFPRRLVIAVSGGSLPDKPDAARSPKPPRSRIDVASSARPRKYFHPMKASARRDDELRDLLASKGLRVTDQRLALLREMAGVKAPISHPE